MREVRDYHRNLAAAYYDYQNACDMFHHEWMGIEKKVRNLMEEVR